MSRLQNRKRVCLFAIAVLAVAGTVQAKTLHVNRTGATEYQSISQAVRAAGNGDTIILDAGVYTGDENCNVPIDGMTLTIRSTDPNDLSVVTETIIDCRGEGDSRRAFEIGLQAAGGLRLEGVRIINGHSLVSGGAILCGRAWLEARQCIFAENRVTWWGGAVCCADSEVTFIGCTFSQNSSETMHGGAICVQASQLDLRKCTFENNVGSAVQNHDGNLTLTGCTFQENTGHNGAAVYSHVDSEVTGAPEVHLARCVFVGNTAESTGGAVHVYNTLTTIEACTFSGNAAGQDGGALYCYLASPFLQNCALIGNAATGLGGAVMNWYDSNLSIINCTLTANDAEYGGAVASLRNSNVLVGNSILWNNSAAGMGDNLYLASYEWGQVYPSTATVTYSDLSGGQSGVYVEPSCTLDWGLGNIDADPLFTGPLQDDYRLSPNSPCAEAGDPNYVPAPGSRDLDGNLRYFGESVDMGAYEFQGLGPVYRFWSPSTNEHFYTVDGAERDWLIREHPTAWTYEEIAYYTYCTQVNERLTPVYRLWAPTLDAHFWTTDEQERDKLLLEYPGLYFYEGVVFYVYPEGRQPLGTLPIYRFWSASTNQHFYTIHEDEKAKLIEQYASVWSYEGVAWYAYPQVDEPEPTARYAFTGGANQAWYVLTLGASVDGQDVPFEGAEIKLVPSDTQMQMTIDFEEKTATLDKLHIHAETTERAATIRPTGSPAIPFVVNVEGSFDLPTQRGPYEIDAKTGTFADFTNAPHNAVGRDSYFTYNGTITLDDRTFSFNRRAGATQFELENSGTFQALDLLPAAVWAHVPLTFQWHRQYVKDLLAEVSINNQVVQVYIAYSYAATNGLWEGGLAQ